MPLRGAKILVIEDNVDLAENLVEILEEDGASVDHAPTAARGLEVASAEHHLALVDIGLPDASGASLVPKLRAVGDGHMAVLLVTGNASIEDAITAVRAGAYDYILKPFDPDVLLAGVERAYERVSLEREANALANALQASEENLRTFVDAVTALLLVLDGQGRVLRANKAVLQATGREANELEGHSWVERHLPDAEKPSVERIIADLAGGAASASHEGRVLRVSATGALSERWVRWQWTAQRIDDELRIFASGLDVTQLRDLERRSRLSQKLAAVGTLSAGLAHEIRNPLNAASLQLQLLERRVKRIDDHEKLLEPVHVVVDEIARLARLVDDFLRFARPADLRARPLDVVALVKGLADLERPAAAQAGATLAFQSKVESLHIEGDPERLRQVFLNLIRNAVEAVSDGGTVTVDVGADGDGVRVSVLDDGPGIEEEHLSRIFEPFFSTKEGGTGLGMAICHSAISLHGGDIEIHLPGAGGTEVRVTLPPEPPRVSAPRTLLGR